MSTFLNKSLEEALEDAKWDAEFSENRREEDLLEEYNATKADKGEQGHDGCFPNLSGPGATVWIKRDGAKGLLCYFDTLEEGYDFGQAFLKKHTPEPVYYTEKACPTDSLNMILTTGKGVIGSDAGLTIGMYKNRMVGSIIWTYMNEAFVVPSGLAMVLGPNGTPKQSCLEVMKDKRLCQYVIPWDYSWQQEVVRS
jgi:hypothetical protein